MASIKRFRSITCWSTDFWTSLSLRSESQIRQYIKGCKSIWLVVDCDHFVLLVGVRTVDGFLFGDLESCAEFEFAFLAVLKPQHNVGQLDASAEPQLLFDRYHRLRYALKLLGHVINQLAKLERVIVGRRIQVYLVTSWHRSHNGHTFSQWSAQSLVSALIRALIRALVTYSSNSLYAWALSSWSNWNFWIRAWAESESRDCRHQDMDRVRQKRGTRVDW